MPMSDKPRTQLTLITSDRSAFERELCHMLGRVPTQEFQKALDRVKSRAKLRAVTVAPPLADEDPKDE